MNLAELLREQGDVPGAIRELDKILEHDPDSRIALWALARAYMDAGDFPKARQALERVDAQNRQNYRIRLDWALLLALEGKRAEALREMDEQLQAYLAISDQGPLWAAEFYAVMGDTGKALEWLDRATRAGDDRETWFRRDPLLANIRDHPRFQQMLDSVAYRRKQRLQTAAQNQR